MRNLLRIASLLMLMFALPVAQAGSVEDLAAMPAIQSLWGRQPGLQVMVQWCADARYKPRNASVCQQADEASRRARMPTEVRTASKGTGDARC